MSVIPPNNNTTLIIDDFINYATAHLSTVGGMINTVSLYPPLGTPAPGVLPWTGYQVSPATVSAASISFENMTDAEAVVIADNAMQDMQDSINSIQVDEETYEVASTDSFISPILQELEPETKRGISGLGNGAPDKIKEKFEDKNNKKEKKFTGKKLQTNLKEQGWLNSQEQPYRVTTIDPKVYGPILKTTYGINLAKAMLSCSQIEQGFVGFNNNIGGFDITAGAWTYNEKLHDGYVFVPEGQSQLLKAFVSFKSLDAFFEKISTSFINKGMDKVTTADQFSKLYYEKWLGGDSATKVCFDTYPNFAKVRGGPYATIEDYRAAVKKTFGAVYKGIGRYVT